MDHVADVDDAALDEHAARLAAALNESSAADLTASAPSLEPEYRADADAGATRLALVNMDWDHIRAVDILAALRSFVPAGSDGTVLRVSVIPSDYGVARMAEEARFGPAPVWNQPRTTAPPTEGTGTAGSAASNGTATKKHTSAASKDSDNRTKGKHHNDKQEPYIKTDFKLGKHRRSHGHSTGDDDDDQDNDGDEFDPERLRAYELNKLKYYYAVVECSTTAVATTL
jgi:hypothetical protein